MRRAGRAALGVGLTAIAIGAADGRAEPGRGGAELRLRELPAPSGATLTMRARRVDRAAPAAEAATATTATDADAGAALTDDHPLPRSRRELEERVIARVSAGYQLDSASLSGQTMRTGVDPAAVTDPSGDSIRTSNPYLMGDAVVGSRGVLMPSLETYLLSRFRFNPDGASGFATLNDVYDRRGGSAFLLRAGYAELDGVGDGALRGLHLRAGRLFRGGTATPLTNFDGATVGWRDERIELDAYVGRRVSLYTIDEPGVVGGGGLVWRGARVAGVPLSASLDYAFFGGVDDPSGAAVSRHAIGGLARASFGRSRVYLRGRIVDRGDGLGIGRVGVRVRHPMGERLLLVGDLEQRFAGELAYDLLAATATDVVDADRLPALGLEPPLASTLLGVRADMMISRTLEAFGFARADVVPGDGTSAQQNGWQELGAALAATRGPLSGSAQAKLRHYQLDADANGAGDLFADTSGSGVSRFTEIAAEARYRLAERKGSAALGVYYRVYDLRSPYEEVDGDGRGGARIEAEYAPSKLYRLAASGEAAQPSPTMARELSTLVSVRLIAEARF